MFRSFLRSGRISLAAVCLAGWCALTVAEDAPGLRSLPQPAGTPQPRPEPLDAQEPPSPELKKILNDWEEHSSRQTRLEGKFHRMEYHKTFRIQMRAIGHYWYEGPDKGRMSFYPDADVPLDPPGNQIRVEEDVEGEIQQVIYTMKRDVETHWTCDGEEIRTYDPATKRYNRVSIPPHLRGTRISEGPLPFLFGIKADKALQRYSLRIGDRTGGSIIHIVAFPRMPAERREYQKAEVLLDAKTFMPRAVKLWDPGGSKETVYLFQEHTRPLVWLRQPWAPLPGYQVLLETEAAPEKDAQGTSETLFR